MPANLSSERSSSFLIQCAERHIHLCSLRKGTTFLIDAIQVPIDNLILKNAETKAASQVLQKKRDVVFLLNTDLDDEIRITYNRIKEFDSKTGVRPIIDTIFTGGNLGSMIDHTIKKQERNNINLIIALKSLGPEHELAELIPSLEEKIKALVAAKEEAEEAFAVEQTCKSQEKVQRQVLVTTYEHNILDATKLFGRKIAARLFPKLYLPKSSTSEKNTIEEA